MNRFARYLLPLTAAAMLAGCGIKESYEQTGAEVAQFHTALDGEKYQAIWKGASPEMRKAASQQQLTTLLEAVHRKLGKVKDTKQVGWNSNATTEGSFVTVTMQTTFERGSGTEAITFIKGDDDRLSLVGYTIQSQDMMVN